MSSNGENNTKYEDKVKSTKAINNFRQSLGLPVVEIKLRLCLSCDREFEGQGSNNRMCSSCQGKQDVFR